MSNNEAYNKIIHDLTKYIRREKLILNEIIEKFENGNLNFDSEEMTDFRPTMEKVEKNFNNLVILLKEKSNE